ncbi:MAG: glycoside hydrolase family 3 protein [Treponema sp.]|nr:glycoside hydrolase family 3 protein [Treponema sp.]
MNCKKYSLLVIFIVLLFNSCKVKDPSPETTKKEISLHISASKTYELAKNLEQKKLKAKQEFLSKLTIKDKVSQLFIVNLEGKENFKPVEKDYIPGGYIFFSYNLADTNVGIMNFNNSIRNYSINNNKIPPFLSVDQEGGVVSRLRKISCHLPSQKAVADTMEISDAKLMYALQAKQMKTLGFDLNLAPVVEILSDYNKDFLEDRSFGDKLSVLTYGKACIDGYEEQKIAAVLKHFPGNSNVDPHTGLPEITLSEKELEETLVPFRELIKENPCGILMSHARISAHDSETPACLSHYWVTEVLREQFGYKGIIFSDDIYMAALGKNGFPPEKAVVMAVEAGIDCIMISEKRISSAVEILISKAKEDKAFEEKLNESLDRMIDYKLYRGILEYQITETGDFIIEPVKPEPALKPRMEKFLDSRDENISLWNEYFSKNPSKKK